MTQRELLRDVIKKVMESAVGLTVLELCGLIRQKAMEAGVVLNEKGEFIDEIGRYSTASFIIGSGRIVLTVRKNVNPPDYPRPDAYDASLASRNLVPDDGLFKLKKHGNDAIIVKVYYLGEAYENNPHATDAARVDMDVFAIEIRDENVDEIAAWAEETGDAVVMTDDEARDVLKDYDPTKTTEAKGACLYDNFLKG